MIVCGHRPRRKQCCSCKGYAGLQCDYPIAEGKTCDKHVCRSCARAIGPDVDYCPFHRGDPPTPPPTQAELDLAGEREADKAAKILGVTR